MPSIFVAALVTTMLSIVIFLPIIRHLAPGSIRIYLLGIGLVGLAISPLAYFFVRVPLMKLLEPTWFGSLIPGQSDVSHIYLRDAVRLCYAPLTEETAKLLPWVGALLAGISLQSSRRRSASLALTIGVSFAIGEFWLVAYLVHASKNPVIVNLPWYAFGGYMSERLMTCFCHTLFVLPTVLFSRRGLGFAFTGLAMGMGLHYLCNTPIVLMHHEAFGISKAVWGILIQVWMVLLVLVSMLTLIGAQYRSTMLKRIWNSRMICPECHTTYRQPLFLALNMGTGRYERCSACRKWHWVTLRNLAPLVEPETSSSKLPDRFAL